jgi:hypothetical protein
MGDDTRTHPAVAVVGIVAGVSLAIVIIFGIFMPARIGVAGLIVSMLALMGAIVAPLAGRHH